MVTRTRLSSTFVPALSVLFQLPDLGSFPMARMLTHITVVCGLCDLTIFNSVTAYNKPNQDFCGVLFLSPGLAPFFSRLGKCKHPGVSGR